MLRNVLIVLAAALFIMVGFVRADDKPATDAVTLSGTLACSKCSLHETAACGNVLQVKDGDKTVNYYLVDNDVSKKAHGKVCHAPVDGVSVTGTVAEQDGKKWITATKIEGLKS